MEAARRHEPHVVGALMDKALNGRRLTREEGYALIALPPGDLPSLFDAARALADQGHGRRVTFSAKVFVPLTTLCRDYCGYCTFRRDPGEPGARTMEVDEVVELATKGERLGVKEALFSLGDRPEAAFPVHGEWLE